MVEEDHRAIKRGVRAMQRFRSFTARGEQSRESKLVKMLRKGQIRWVSNNDLLGQVAFFVGLFGVAIAA
jgi:transposase-like protein